MRRKPRKSTLAEMFERMPPERATLFVLSLCAIATLVIVGAVIGLSAPTPK